MEGDVRRLAAVLLSDMVGYSAITQRDESLALSLVREQDEIVRATVARRGGTVVKSTGDGALVVFDSALDAVGCALEVQSAVHRRNEATEGEPLTLRIGVHLGDVVYRGGDVFGDAVNIVARIEPLSDHGGVCVSQQVYDQVRNKVDVAFEAIGAPSLKNIVDAPALYRVVPLDAGERAHPPALRVADAEVASRLVVLPFASISPDPADGYIAEGMTEELISRLAHVEGLSVIARTTAMHYQGSAKTALEIGRELRVGFVLESSVRRSGSRLRITAQLIETRGEAHLWADRYDREMGDIFLVQDEIAAAIVEAVSARLHGAPAPPPATGRGTDGPPPGREPVDVETYTEYLQARSLMRQRVSEATIRDALARFERAAERDPAFARARVGVAEALMWLATEGAAPFVETEARARREVEAALGLDDSLAEAHAAVAMQELATDNFTRASREARRAIELNASLGEPYRVLAQIEAGDGNIDAAIGLLERAHAIDPLDINVIAFLGRAYLYAGRVDRALEHWSRNEAVVPFRVNAQRAEYYLGLGDPDAAEACVREMLRLRPGNAFAISFRGMLAAQRGDVDDARAAVEELEALARAGHGTVAFLEGFVELALGDLDRFFELMDVTLETNQLPLLELLYSPIVASARPDPRMGRLIGRQQALRR